ncbi:MAG: hypothetical protein FWD39_05125 [Clostridiales bacterium]|nr:hypothetical protein [Clostridiales bacterium]
MEMQRFLIFAASMAAIIILTRLGRNWLNKRASRKPPNEKASTMIKQPTVYLYIGIAATIFSIALVLAIMFMPASIFADPEQESNRLTMAMLFLPFYMASIWALLFSANWKIEIGENEFTFRNLWGRRRTYQYDGMEGKLTKAGTGMRYYHNGKYILAISMLQENYAALDNAIAAHRKRKREEQKKNKQKKPD